MALDPEQLLQIQEFSRQLARNILDNPTRSRVEESVEISTNRPPDKFFLRERYWKQAGFVFRQINDDPPEITPYKGMPLVIARFDPEPPWEKPK